MTSEDKNTLVNAGVGKDILDAVETSGWKIDNVYKYQGSNEGWINFDISNSDFPDSPSTHVELTSGERGFVQSMSLLQYRYEGTEVEQSAKELSEQVNDIRDSVVKENNLFADDPDVLRKIPENWDIGRIEKFSEGVYTTTLTTSIRQNKDTTVGINCVFDGSAKGFLEEAKYTPDCDTELQNKIEDMTRQPDFYASDIATLAEDYRTLADRCEELESAVNGALRDLRDIEQNQVRESTIEDVRVGEPVTHEETVPEEGSKAQEFIEGLNKKNGRNTYISKTDMNRLQISDDFVNAIPDDWVVAYLYKSQEGPDMFRAIAIPKYAQNPDNDVEVNDVSISVKFDGTEKDLAQKFANEAHEFNGVERAMDYLNDDRHYVNLDIMQNVVEQEQELQNAFDGLECSMSGFVSSVELKEDLARTAEVVKGNVKAERSEPKIASKSHSGPEL